MSVDLDAGLPQLSDAEQTEMRSLGVVRTPIDACRIGAFRYSSLTDAVAQAKRSR